MIKPTSSFMLLNFIVVLLFLSFTGSYTWSQYDDKSPRQYVEEAAKRVNENYIKEKYSSTSFLRLYQSHDGEIKRLTEVQASLLFNIEQTSRLYTRNQAVAIKNIRTTDVTRMPYYKRFDFALAFFQDPIAYPTGSILDPNVIRYANFEFETDFSYEYVTIRYTINDFSTNVSTVDGGYSSFRSKIERETGIITINRETFVITKIERDITKRREYSPKVNYFSMGRKSLYAEELNESKTILEYAEFMEKYYLKRIYEMRDVNLYKQGTFINYGNYVSFREYTFGAPSKTVNPEVAEDFALRPEISRRPCMYDPNKWRAKMPDFYFLPQRDVYFAMERYMPLEEQFSCKTSEK